MAAIKKPRRVILYVPNLSDLSAAGTWSKSDSNVASALAPFMDEGSIFLLGESVPEEFERGLGANSSLSRLLDKVLVQETSPERTREILAAVRASEQSAMADEILSGVMELSSQFLSHISRPGSAVELLKAAIKAEKESGSPPDFRDVLRILSKSTGIPVDLLDDAAPLDGAAVRAFFAAKIIGQTEAVDAVVDLITLIKAGLTDPHKPLGIFLFVGPTGVGKTELARALAEYIFGDAARLKRFDMSEFANLDGFTRLIGGRNENGLLTDAVRQHPFSVVLLDEIEKGHHNVFDLCLQLFDAGRLTDGHGRLVDFRRTIVILTSNVGATAMGPTVGFVPAPNEGVDSPDKDRTFRELSRLFRPEFLNRLDRIIQFRPLSLQMAEQIARRELDLVLQRSGIRRRHLVVDVAPAVVSLLVREGYSPHFGARPLKRTVERFLLLPLARAISSGSLMPGSILHLSEQNGRIEARVAARPHPAPSSEASLKREALSGTSSSLQERLDGLRQRHENLMELVQPLADRKSELLCRTQQPDFFRLGEERAVILGEIHGLEQFLDLHQGVAKGLMATEQRLRHPVRPLDEPDLRRRVDRLEGEIGHLAFVARCRDALDLGDALAVIALVHRKGSPQGGAQKMAAMLQGLAQRRRMTAEVLGELYNETQDQVYLLVSGLGAYALLKDESGLHQFDRRFKERTPRAGREVMREDRELLRVAVHGAGMAPSKQFRQKAKTRITSLKPVHQRLVKADLAVSIFDDQSVRSVEFWTSGPKTEAIEKALTVLHAVAKGPDNPAASVEVVRYYDVGLSPRVKDARSGRSTTRVDQVLKGDLTSLGDLA